MGALSPLLFSPRGRSLQHLLVWERGRGCLGMEDTPCKKSRPKHAHCQSVCLSLGDPKCPSQPCTPCLWVLMYIPCPSISISAPVPT